MDKSNSIDFLHAENARLIALLELHGIDWKMPLNSTLVQPVSKEADSTLSTDEKVALFMRLFRGRTDAYPVR